MYNNNSKTTFFDNLSDYFKDTFKVNLSTLGIKKL